MSFDLRNDLKELLYCILLAAVGFFLMYSTADAQPHNNGLTLDMTVYRTTVYDSVNEEQSLSSNFAHRTTITTERVRLEFPNRNEIILHTSKDTIEVELISIWENCIYVDNNTGQHYFVARSLRKKTFFFNFYPIPPLIRQPAYAIHVEPYLPYSRAGK